MPSRTLGIRREDKNVWERRVPVTPDTVARLVADHGLAVRVERFPRRVYPDEAFAAAGAALVDDCFDADFVVAVKEIPAHLFRPGGTYLFFSHTVKGQPGNMPMLRRLVEQRCTLLDYERVVDAQGRRLIFFSWFAGAAGMIDTLTAAGQRYRWLGQPNPFEAVRPAHAYADLPSACSALEEVGGRIRREGLPVAMAPFVVGITGYGNVSQGAQHVLDCLPVEEVLPADLARIRAATGTPRDRLFKVVFHEEHTVTPVADGAPFVLEEYFRHPDRYRAVFERHVGHLDVLVNGVYWTAAHPRLLPLELLHRRATGGEPLRLQVIGDISCDVGGSVECCVKATDSDEPCYVWDPVAGEARDGVEGPGVVVMAVDNLPCELPREAADTFSRALEPYLPALVRTDFGVPSEALALPPEFRRALLLHRGEFTPDYRYMADFVR
jgi:saccharopine dehydrogenase (NAD+, L-lysine forming)